MLRSVYNSVRRVKYISSFRTLDSCSVFRVLNSSLLRGQLKPQEIVRPVHLCALRLTRHANNVEDIDRSLLRLDNEIRRTGRIGRQEIIDILHDIQDMKKATSSQSLMIIRCCGELVPSETPENRTKLVQEVWKTMETLNVPMDISHYNALLRVYLENEHKFNPTEFLQGLTSKGVEPNRVTYQRLIARFCQDGDIDGASTILQHMKEKQLPINEHVFNALIHGHAMADDMESAEGILSVMKQAGLEPNDDTFVTLMCGYGRKGDIDNIKRIVKECEEKDVLLIDRDFINLIYVLATSNQSHLIEEVFPFLKKHSGFNQDATNVILRLVNLGKEEIAYRILKEMTRLTKNDEVLPSGNFFLYQMALSSTPSETIIKYCKLMQEEGLHPCSLSKACEHALSLGKCEKAVDLLDALKQEGAPIRQHYFWPFFASSKSEKGVYDGLKYMQSLGFTPNNETLRDYVVPALLKQSQNQSSEKTLEKLSSYSQIPMRTLVPAAMQHLLNQKDVELAAKLATTYRMRFNNPQLRKAIVDSYIRNKDTSSFVRIVASSGVDGEDQARECAGMMLIELLESVRPKDKASYLLPVLKELLSVGVGISNSGSEIIQNNLGEDLNSELTNLIMQLTSGELTPKYDLAQQQKRTGVNELYQSKSTEELERLLEEAVKARKPTKSLKKALLFNYCRHQNVEKAENIRQDLASEGFIFTSGMHALLLDLYSLSNKLEEAKGAYAILVNSAEFPVDDLKILRYANLLLNNEQYDECLEVLQNARRDESHKPAGALQQATAWKLLNTAAESGNIERTRALFQTLKDRNLTVVNNVILGPLVKAYLVKDDLVGALEEFERCAKEYRFTPWKQELFVRLIKAEDTDNLQKVMDLSTNLHGEVNSMYDLVFAFIQCGKLRQAKKILETPGLRARNDKIELTCKKYVEEDRVSELENLIQVTKDLVDIDRNTMYFHLLQLYCKQEDDEKAVSIWTSLQEENLQPSPDLLVYLADFLQKKGKPVPFVLPTSENQNQDLPSSKTKSSNSITSEFRRSITTNDIDQALQIKQRLDGDASQEKLNIKDISSLVDKMTRAERLGEATRLTEELFERGMHPYIGSMKFLISKLATAGEFNSLIRLGSLLTPELQRQTAFHGRLCIAHINAGRGKEYFETYTKKAVEELGGNLDEYATAIPPSLGYILVKHEELFSEFESLATQAEEKGNLVLRNIIWTFHLMKKDFSKAKEVWNSKLKTQPRVLFRAVISESKSKKDEVLAKELCDSLMSSEALSNPSKALACGCVAQVLCANGKPEEGLAYLQETLKVFKIEDFNTGILQDIKNHVEAKNLIFPYQIPERDSRRKQASSDSDSD